MTAGPAGDGRFLMPGPGRRPRAEGTSRQGCDGPRTGRARLTDPRDVWEGGEAGLPFGPGGRMLNLAGPRCGGRGSSCRVCHAAIQALRCIQVSGALAHPKYSSIFNESLMCIVFVPSNSACQRTLHHPFGAVAENLRMIRPCAAVAETEGTCPSSARACCRHRHGSSGISNRYRLPLLPVLRAAGAVGMARGAGGAGPRLLKFRTNRRRSILHTLWFNIQGDRYASAYFQQPQSSGSYFAGGGLRPLSLRGALATRQSDPSRWLSRIAASQ
jgi:hypothetical protein